MSDHYDSELDDVDKNEDVPDKDIFDVPIPIDSNQDSNTENSGLNDAPQVEPIANEGQTESNTGKEGIETDKGHTIDDTADNDAANNDSKDEIDSFKRIQISLLIQLKEMNQIIKIPLLSP